MTGAGAPASSSPGADDVNRPLAGRPVAVNGADSLSGWVSLRAVVGTLGPVLTTGAHDDLQRASDIARRMVTDFGMSERHGPLTLGRRHGNPFLGRDLMEDRNYSEDVAKAIDEEVRQMMEGCYETGPRARPVDRPLLLRHAP